MKKWGIGIFLIVVLMVAVKSFASTVTKIDNNTFAVTDDLGDNETYTMNQINSYVKQAQSSLSIAAKQKQTADETYASWYGVQQNALNEISN